MAAWETLVWFVVAHTLLDFSGVCGFDGCKIRFGRRGCLDRVHTGVLATCDGDGEYSEIPPVIPSDTVYISLNNFQFDRLMRANFSRFIGVECMNIMNSVINDVDYDTFADNEALHELELSNTNMDSSDLTFITHPKFTPVRVSITQSPLIETLNFYGTPTLTKITGLSLAGNRLRRIEPTLLASMPNLETLELSNNELSELSWSKLARMTKLNKLYLDNNNMQSIPDDVFKTFFAVKELKIAGNPFHCNCNLKWLRRFYEDTSDRIIDLEEVMCNSPKKSKMISTEMSAFECKRPTDLLIKWYPLDKSLKEYAVNCSSTADPAPTLTMTFPDHRKLITPPSEDLSQLTTSTPKIISAPGTVTCTAENSENVAFREDYVPPAGKNEIKF